MNDEKQKALHNQLYTIIIMFKNWQQTTSLFVKHPELQYSMYDDLLLHIILTDYKELEY